MLYVAPFQNCNQVNYLLGFFSFPFSSKSLESNYLTYKSKYTNCLYKVDDTKLPLLLRKDCYARKRFPGFSVSFYLYSRLYLFLTFVYLFFNFAQHTCMPLLKLLYHYQHHPLFMFYILIFPSSSIIPSRPVSRHVEVHLLRKVFCCLYTSVQ